MKSTRAVPRPPSRAQARLIAESLVAARLIEADHPRALVLFEDLLHRSSDELGHSDVVALEMRRRLIQVNRRSWTAEEAEREWRLLRRASDALPEDEPLRSQVRMEHLMAERQVRPRSQEVLGKYVDAVAERKRIFGPESYRVAMARTNLAVALRESGDPARLQEALDIAESEVSGRSRDYGADHTFTLVAKAVTAHTLLAMADLPSCPDRTGYLRRALGHANEVLRVREARLGPHHSGTTKALRLRAACLERLGSRERAVALLMQAVAVDEQRADPESVGRGCLLLAELLAHGEDAADRADALRYAERAYELLRTYRVASALTTRAFRLVGDLRRREADEGGAPPSDGHR